mmetsp:Transcript_8217/g.21011  ORF Transcript_8217/g.21011 Transcript_8217/m.21011 type:complete len:201 (-) Transcript_8217:171-773(-)
MLSGGRGTCRAGRGMLRFGHIAREGNATDRAHGRALPGGPVVAARGGARGGGYPRGSEPPIGRRAGPRAGRCLPSFRLVAAARHCTQPPIGRRDGPRAGRCLPSFRLVAAASHCMQPRFGRLEAGHSPAGRDVLRFRPVAAGRHRTQPRVQAVSVAFQGPARRRAPRCGQASQPCSRQRTSRAALERPARGAVRGGGGPA